MREKRSISASHDRLAEHGQPRREVETAVAEARRERPRDLVHREPRARRDLDDVGREHVGHVVRRPARGLHGDDRNVAAIRGAQCGLVLLRRSAGEHAHERRRLLDRPADPHRARCGAAGELLRQLLREHAAHDERPLVLCCRPHLLQEAPDGERLQLRSHQMSDAMGSSVSGRELAALGRVSRTPPMLEASKAAWAARAADGLAGRPPGRAGGPGAAQTRQIAPRAREIMASII